MHEWLKRVKRRAKRKADSEPSKLTTSNWIVRLISPPPVSNTSPADDVVLTIDEGDMNF